MLLIGTLFVLGFIIFAIQSIVSLIKRNGKFKRNAIITAVCFVVFLVVAVNNSDSSDETKEINAESEGQEDKDEKGNKKLEIDKEIRIGKVTIDLQTVKVEGDELSVWAWWYHGATREKIHFSVLATMSVLQDGEYLDVVEGEDTFLRQTGYGVDSNLDVKYKLIDKDSPVEIRFRTTTNDPEEESVTIDIKE